MTKHYKDANNDIFGFEDNDAIPDGLTEITMAEIPAIVAAKLPVKTAAEILAEKRATATLSRREFFLGLESTGFYDKVAALRDDPATAKAVKIEIDTATSFDRTWPTLLAMATKISVTEAQLDTLFGIV